MVNRHASPSKSRDDGRGELHSTADRPGVQRWGWAARSLVARSAASAMRAATKVPEGDGSRSPCRCRSGARSAGPRHRPVRRPWRCRARSEGRHHGRGRASGIGLCAGDNDREARQAPSACDGPRFVGLVRTPLSHAPLAPAGVSVNLVNLVNLSQVLSGGWIGCCVGKRRNRFTRFTTFTSRRRRGAGPGPTGREGPCGCIRCGSPVSKIPASAAPPTQPLDAPPPSSFFALKRQLPHAQTPQHRPSAPPPPDHRLPAPSCLRPSRTFWRASRRTHPFGVWTRSSHHRRLSVSRDQWSANIRPLTRS